MCQRFSQEQAVTHRRGSFFALMSSKANSVPSAPMTTEQCALFPGQVLQPSHHLFCSETSASATTLILVQMFILQSSSNYLSTFSHATISVKKELPGNNHQATKSVFMTLYYLQMVCDRLYFSKWAYNLWEFFFFDCIYALYSWYPHYEQNIDLTFYLISRTEIHNQPLSINNKEYLLWYWSNNSFKGHWYRGKDSCGHHARSIDSRSKSWSKLALFIFIFLNIWI